MTQIAVYPRLLVQQFRPTIVTPSHLTLVFSGCGCESLTHLSHLQSATNITQSLPLALERQCKSTFAVPSTSRGHMFIRSWIIQHSYSIHDCNTAIVSMIRSCIKDMRDHILNQVMQCSFKSDRIPSSRGY